MVALIRYKGNLNPNQIFKESIDIFNYNEDFVQFVVRAMSNANFQLKIILKRSNSIVKQQTITKKEQTSDVVFYFLNTNDFDVIEVELKNLSGSISFFHLSLEGYEDKRL